MTDSNQHPMWLVTIYTEGGFHVIPSRVGFSGPDLSTDDFRSWLRAPTDSAALARAEAMRVGKPETDMAEVVAALLKPTSIEKALSADMAEFSKRELARTGIQPGQIDLVRLAAIAAAPTIRVRACIAIVNGKLWGVYGSNAPDESDDTMQDKASDIAGPFEGDHLQFDFGHIDVPLRQPAEITGAVEPPKENDNG